MATERDEAVEAIVAAVEEEMPLLQCMEPEEYRATIRRAAAVAREMGQRESLEGPCSRAEAFAKGKAEGRREAFEEAARVATPPHANGSADPGYPKGPDGCPRFCSACHTSRTIRDAIRALAKEGR